MSHISIESWCATALAVVLLGGFGGTRVHAEDAEAVCEGKPYLVKIHADWCGSCKATKAVWKRVQQELGKQTTVVVLDVSSRTRYEKAVAEAERLEIEEFFQEYRTRTGVVGALHCRTREPVVILQGESDFEKYRQAVEKASGTS